MTADQSPDLVTARRELRAALDGHRVQPDLRDNLRAILDAHPTPARSAFDHDLISRLRAEVERLTAENDELREDATTPAQSSGRCGACRDLGNEHTMKPGCRFAEKPAPESDDVFCSECGTMMIATRSGHQCPVEDWHDECSLDKCGFDPGDSCGLREGYEPRTTPAQSSEQEVVALREEIQAATEEYRRIFPEPYSLSPNLNLAVRAIAAMENEAMRADGITSNEAYAVREANRILVERDDALARLKALTSDAAVEAAAEAIWQEQGYSTPWDVVANDQRRDGIRILARAALTAAVATLPEPDRAEEGRRIASRRDDLIASGVDPTELEVPLHPVDAGE